MTDPEQNAALARAQAVLDCAADGDPSLAAHRALKAIQDNFGAAQARSDAIQMAAKVADMHDHRGDTGAAIRALDGGGVK